MHQIVFSCGSFLLHQFGRVINMAASCMVCETNCVLIIWHLIVVFCALDRDATFDCNFFIISEGQIFADWPLLFIVEFIFCFEFHSRRKAWRREPQWKHFVLHLFSYSYQIHSTPTKYLKYTPDCGKMCIHNIQSVGLTTSHHLKSGYVEYFQVYCFFIHNQVFQISTGVCVKYGPDLTLLPNPKIVGMPGIGVDLRSCGCSCLCVCFNPRR